MKEICCFAFAALFLFCSCERSDVHEQESPIKTVKANTTRNKVSNVDLSIHLSSKGYYPSKSMEGLNIEPIIFNSDTVMYLINYPKGWEVLSADKRASKVLIASEEGNISVSDLYANPAIEEHMSVLGENLQYLINNPEFTPLRDIPDRWESLDSFYMDRRVVPVLDRTVVTTVAQHQQDHLMQTKWGQGNPWNEYAPYTNATNSSHCYTGCGPVAVAQTLYYLQSRLNLQIPVYGVCQSNSYIPDGSSYITLSSSDISTDSLSTVHWDSMALSQSSPEGHEKVSSLMVWLGYLIGATYYTNQTTASMTDMYLCISSDYGIPCTYENTDAISDFSQFVEDQVYTNTLPIIARIYNPTSGHFVILDGYKYIKQRVKKYYHFVFVYDDGLVVDSGESWTETTYTEAEYTAINWGWDGTLDGNSDGTIWYNLNDDWYAAGGYSESNLVIYGFSSPNV